MLVAVDVAVVVGCVVVVAVAVDLADVGKITKNFII
jgi:hypothetical protein